MTTLALTLWVAQTDAQQGILEPLLGIAIVLLGIRVMLRGLLPGRRRCARCGCDCTCRCHRR